MEEPLHSEVKRKFFKVAALNKGGHGNHISKKIGNI